MTFCIMLPNDPNFRIVCGKTQIKAITMEINNFLKYKRRYPENATIRKGPCVIAVNAGPDQPAQLRRLIRAFVAC